MRADTLKIVIGEAAYYVDDPRPGDGVKATVSVVMEGEPLARPLHRDRLNLDSAKARDKFAKEAGTDPDDLNEVRDRVLDFLAPAAPSSAETSDETDPEVSKAAMALLDAPNVLDQVRTAIAALGYAGDRTQPLLVFLVLLSRLLARPINLVVGGPSAAGKSFLVMLVARLFPSVATYSLNGMSERVLVYTDADLRHRTLIVAEAAALHRDGIGAALLRSIAWEGSVVYETVEKTPDGLQPRRIEKEGPTGFVTTTTKSVEAELETRVLTIHVPDDPKATRTILLATAERANGRLPDAPDLRPWHELQRWLVEEGTHEVTIPYADRLGAAYPAEKVRSRRDFTQLLGLIQACALLHQRQRESDAAGRVIATEADYRVVYDLTHPVFGAIAAEGVTPAVRAAVQKVAEMIKDMDGGTVTLNQLSTALDRDKSTVSRHVRAALAGGFLVNDETGKGKPSRLRVGDPLPEERPALPHPSHVFDTPTATLQHPADSAESSHNRAENTVAEPDATVVQQCNGQPRNRCTVAEVLQSPMQQSFSHDDAENEALGGECCSVAVGDEAELQGDRESDGDPWDDWAGDEWPE